MAETSAGNLFIGRLSYLMVAVLLIFIQLLPLNTEPTIWAAPDWLLAVTLVWVARRPDYAPFWIILVVFFLTDLLFQRPPGLWSAIVVITTEMIRARARGLRNVSPLLEWGTIIVAILGATLVNRIVLAVVMTPQPPFGLMLIQTVMTILCYPLVALVVQLLFGLRRSAPGQVDSLGHRL